MATQVAQLRSSDLAVSRTQSISWTLWCMGLATAARYVFVIGMIASPTLAKPHPLRFVGALGTYVMGMVLSVALVI